MGREVRRVPERWEHPRDEKGYFIPLHGYSFADTLREWEEGERKWKEGLHRNYVTEEWVPIDEQERKITWEEWTGKKPAQEDYMPDWPPEERTHLQMYEDTTEGTPISPVMASPEELAHWLADNGASACGSMTANFEQWLATIERGYAFSMVAEKGVIKSGVEFQHKGGENEQRIGSSQT